MLAPVITKNITMSILKLLQQNVAAASAYTEYSIVIPAGPGGKINEFTVALRDIGAKIFWYTTSTPNATKNAAGLPYTYNTIGVGGSRTIRGQLGSQTVYFQCDKDTQVLEADYYADA